MVDFLHFLKNTSYPGRGILVGKDRVYYFIMGRSRNSRNRIFVETDDGIRTEAHDPALLEEPLSSGHQDTPQEEEPTMAQKLHTTPLNQHRNRESVQKPETTRKGPKKPPRRKTTPVR